MSTGLIKSGFVVYRRTGAAKTLGKPFKRQLHTDAQEYPRELVGSGRWEPIDCGWVTEASLLMVENMSEDTLQLTCGGVKTMVTRLTPMIDVPAGERVEFTPTDVTRWSVLANGKYRITLVPL